MTSSYLDLVRSHTQLLPLPWQAGPARPMQAVADDAPVCLICAPHPDDEALMGGLAWRLRHEQGWRVVNLAMTLGSRTDRQAARWKEAQACCTRLGFELQAASGVAGQPLPGVHPDAALRQSQEWRGALAHLRRRLLEWRPRLIIAPHDQDGHPAHIATAWLVRQAVAQSLSGPVDLLSAEYWQTHPQPRLAVGLSDTTVAELMAGLALHQGEVARNPYHLLLPAWFMDSARRGAERVGALGAPALSFALASLYGWQRWEDSHWRDMPPQALAPGTPLELDPAPTASW